MDYNKEFEKTIGSFGGEKKRLLLHACCAPCSTVVLERLEDFFDITLYFYNPNIDTVEEYYKRAAELDKLREKFKLQDIIVLPYKTDDFVAAAYGVENESEGGARCAKCVTLRLSCTALHAVNNGFDYFCTTLTVSPHKNSKIINESGEVLSKDLGINYLYSDFKKKEGYKRSIAISKELNLYRQNYCGCSFTKTENNIIL